MDTTKLFEHLMMGTNLTPIDMQQIMHACMMGELSDVQIAVFLALMRMKGETVEELTAAAYVMMNMAHSVDLGPNLIDIVGTGGDNKHTFNISTISGIVAAAGGVKVAKHGNRAISSRSGSMDLLIEAGFKWQLTDEQLATCLQVNNICFLFAPQFHQAMQRARSARQQLGARSLFNLLGPLINPARVKRQVVGVFAHYWQQPMAQILANLGSERAFVIHSRDGMDEVSISDITDVIEYCEGKFTHWNIDPRHYGCYHKTIDSIIVKSAAESLDLIHMVLDGKLGPARDIVILNAAMGLYLAGISSNYGIAVEKAAAIIDSGNAQRCFEQLISFE